MAVVYVAPSPHDDDRGTINNVQYEKAKTKWAQKVEVKDSLYSPRI